MSRFFVSIDAVDSDNGKITITGEDVRHIRSVLRSVPGSAIQLSDGLGMDYDVIIESIEKDVIITKIMDRRPNITEPPVNMTLFQGIPKADKMEYIIQKCVELGVMRIVPVITSRTVVRFDDSRDAAAKTARWKRIALEAAKQCDRGIVPVVEEPVRFDEALQLSGSCGLRLMPYEEEMTGNIRQHLQTYKLIGAGSVAVFIGPEGGFSTEEVQKAVEGGFKSVTLGPRILRTETAGIAVAAIIMYELGDMAMM